MTLCFRISRYQQFKNFEKRIMVATDLFGRGIDIERVNIVINYDMPDNTDSYLHRVSIFIKDILFFIRQFILFRLAVLVALVRRVSLLLLYPLVSHQLLLLLLLLLLLQHFFIFIIHRRSEDDSEMLNQVQARFEVSITEMPSTLQSSSYSKLFTHQFHNINSNLSFLLFSTQIFHPFYFQSTNDLPVNNNFRPSTRSVIFRRFLQSRSAQ